MQLAPLSRADLSRADLPHADLSRAGLPPRRSGGLPGDVSPRFPISGHRGPSLRSLGLLAVCLTAITMQPGRLMGAPPEETTRPLAGLRHNPTTLHAIEHVRITVRPGEVIEEGTIVVRDGLIEAVGSNVEVPAGAKRWDGKGKSVFAGFIDSYAEIATPPVEARQGDVHWNAQVTPQVVGVETFKPSPSVNRSYRSGGFVARLLAPVAGIFKGQSGVVSTADVDSTNAVVRPAVAQHLRLTVGRQNRSEYPNSPMGAVAVARQAMYDARWYDNAWKQHREEPSAPRPEQNSALEALRPVLAKRQPLLIDALDEQYFLRAEEFAKEFDINWIAVGSGREYRQLAEIAATKRAVIVPLNFTKPPAVSTTEQALVASLERMMHWDHAPTNPGRLAKAGVTILLTGHGLKERSEFWPSLRKAIKRGLSADAALAALTVAPAEQWGLARLGTVEAGKSASFVIVDGDPFREAKAKFTAIWIDGTVHELEASDRDDLSGAWSVTLQTPAGAAADKLTVTFSGEPGKPKAKVAGGTGKPVEAKNVSTTNGRVLLNFSAQGFQEVGGFQPLPDQKGDGTARFTASIAYDDNRPHRLLGTISWPDESIATFVAVRGKESSTARRGEPVEAPRPAADGDGTSFPVNFPLGEYGVAQAPEPPKDLAIQNVTAWTCGPQGTIKNATVLLQAGKITAVGSDIAIPAGATLIDGQGLHLSPGLIDCHSHMATDGGVNESGQAVTAEVRVGDFIDATDIDIYRQLAGGVTSSNILHGSANPIGGQNQVIKLRWGQPYANLKFKQAPAGIKFALGENVKQSNWGSEFSSRYPQTRMGVKEIIRDRFLAAREYRFRQQQYAQTGRGLPPRQDLELEALAEILEGKRWIHCHSYRQDEILALLRTLDEFGVTIGTLQHILEGYKVADQMAKHGAMGSAFSDWWAYKFEVYDAIPFAGALMHRNGVVVSFNSDDRELARHLNQEAAKAVKYGGVPPEEALKFVTLNPARQLRIDQYVGSIEVGKHADLVLWTAPPLSNFAVVDRSWIDGTQYFSRTASLARTEQERTMRASLIQKILASGESTADATEEAAEERNFWPRDDLFCRCRAALANASRQLGQNAARNAAK